MRSARGFVPSRTSSKAVVARRARAGRARLVHGDTGSAKVRTATFEVYIHALHHDPSSAGALRGGDVLRRGSARGSQVIRRRTGDAGWKNRARSLGSRAAGDARTFLA